MQYRSRRWTLPIWLVLATIFYGALPPHAFAAGALPRTAGSTVAPLSAWFLALPHAAFPHGARIQGARTGNRAADQAGRLHTRSFATLGRIDGYLEQARWRLPSDGNAPVDITLQYAAAIFAAAEPAATAYADAIASLWENGRPREFAGSPRLFFLLRATHHRQQIDLAAYDGPVEVELTLTLPAGLASSVRRIAETQLAHAATMALQVVRREVAGLPPALRAPVALMPAVDPAPVGTGPVVKSPSLMVMDWPQSPPHAALDEGEYRVATRPAIAAASSASRSLVSTAGLSCYTRTAALGRHGGLYDSATLFANPDTAHRAMHTPAHASAVGSWLRPMALRPYSSSLARLPLADEVFAWTGGGETVLMVRQQNVLLTIDAVGTRPAQLEALADRLLATVPSWLAARGTQIVDAFGQPVVLSGLNWYGFDQQDFVVGGLDYRSFAGILTTIKGMGYNSIRLPFSNQVVEQNPIVTAHLRANPELQGLHALEIMDRIVGEAGALGLSVILDDHRSEAGWSSEPNGLWYTPTYPESAFIRDWSLLAARYAGADVVVGADLRNEPHGAASWGDGNVATDWRLAAEHAGDAVLAANPKLLVIVEGVQYSRDGANYWWGGNLKGVADSPVTLQFSDGATARSRLVYSAHDYGKDNCGIGCPWFNAATTYDSLAQVWDQFWGYIAADPTKPYAAPVWVGEFGTCNDQPACVRDAAAGSQGQWFASLVRYLAEHNLGWAYWSVNGTQSTADARVYGDLDWYGLFSQDWSRPQPQLSAVLQSLQSGSVAGSPDASP